jgi:protein-tyrosine phosphatase
MSDLDRRIVLEGAFNFRDLGGYPAAQGRTIAWRRLFRSDGLSRLTANDLLTLVDLGIETVVDLRTAGERERDSMPDGPFTPAVHHLPMMDVLPTEDELTSWVDEDFLIGRYSQMLDDGSAAIAEAVRVLSAPHAVPAVFHCAAGKDRTGILAAVVLGLLGVPDDVIADDYAMSQAAMVEFFEFLKRQYPDKEEELLRREAQIESITTRVMRGLIDHVEQTYAGFLGFADHLGVADRVPVLRDAVLD